MTIAGHQTSISLEPFFWDALKVAADVQGLPINALVAQIDVERLESDTPCGLASAIRLWLAANIQKSTATKTSDGTIATLGEMLEFPKICVHGDR